MLLAANRSRSRLKVNVLLTIPDFFNRPHGLFDRLRGNTLPADSELAGEGVCQKLFDLPNRSRLDHEDWDTAFFSVNNWLKAVAVIAALGHQDVGVFEIFYHNRRNAQFFNRLDQTAAGNANRVDSFFSWDCDIPNLALFFTDLVYRVITLGVLLVFGSRLPSVSLERSGLHAAAAPERLGDCWHIWLGCL